MSFFSLCDAFGKLGTVTFYVTTGCFPTRIPGNQLSVCAKLGDFRLAPYSAIIFYFLNCETERMDQLFQIPLSSSIPFLLMHFIF